MRLERVEVGTDPVAAARGRARAGAGAAVGGGGGRGDRRRPSATAATARCASSSRALTAAAAPRRTRCACAAEDLDPALLDDDVRAGLEVAITNVALVADAGVGDDVEVALPQGHRVVLREVPVARAAIYVPGGRAPYPSSLVMGVVTARAAGVEEVVVLTPPEIAPVIRGTCALCGVHEVYAMGGAHGIAALAFGTETIPRVDVIAGPGSLIVQEAKRQVSAAASGSTGSTGRATWPCSPTRPPMRGSSRSTSSRRASTGRARRSSRSATRAMARRAARRSSRSCSAERPASRPRRVRARARRLAARRARVRRGVRARAPRARRP